MCFLCQRNVHSKRKLNSKHRNFEFSFVFQLVFLFLLIKFFYFLRCCCFDSFVVFVILQSCYSLLVRYILDIQFFFCSFRSISSGERIFFCHFSYSMALIETVIFSRFKSNVNTCSLRLLYSLHIVHLCIPKSIQSNRNKYTGSMRDRERGKKRHSFHLNDSLNEI